MNLSTFSAILTFALDTEDRSIAFLEKLIVRKDCLVVRPALEEIVQVKKKHRRTLETIRRENITEMILEPVRNLKTVDFPSEIPQKEVKTLADGIQAALAAEKMASRFLLTASEKLNLAEVAKALKKLQTAKEDLIGKIKKLYA
jgi:rubrerythrin